MTGLFDAPQQRYPKKWKEMSVDYRLAFVYHGCMMTLFIAGQFLSVRQELVFTILLVAILVTLSMRHRLTNKWHWPGIRKRDIVYAVVGALFVGFFLYAATPWFPPLAPAVLPWYLAGLGIGTFSILSSLRIVYASEAEFLVHCRAVDRCGQEIQRAVELPEPKETEAAWNKPIRGVYYALFVLVWLASSVSFYYFGRSFRNGSPVPTATQSEALVDHGKTVYVTPAEKRRIDYVQITSWLGIPLVLVCGPFLHFVLGVKLYPGAPTLAEWKKRKRAGPPPAAAS